MVHLKMTHEIFGIKKNNMKNFVILILASILLVGCVTYRQPTRPQVISVLAITSEGDTIQVPTDYLEREFRTNPGTYSNWRFQWDNTWYWGNGWFYYYNPYWYNPRYYYPQRPIIIQRPRVSKPRVQSPRPNRTYIPRHFEPRTPETPDRGRSNVQPWVKPQQPPRVQPQQRTTQSVPSRNGNTTPSRVQQRTTTPSNNQPTRSRVQTEPTSQLKPKWYVPQQSPSGMVTPQFRYQTNDGGFGFNGPGAFQRNYQ